MDFKGILERISSLASSVSDWLFPIHEDISNFLNSNESLVGAYAISQNGANEFEAILNYRNRVVRRAVWELKYRGNRAVARKFAQLLEDRLQSVLEDEVLFENTKALVIPIPLSEARRRERGFNQMELVLEAVPRGDKNYFEVANGALIKIRDTPPQTSVRKRKDRLSNLNGCFTVVDKNSVKNKTVVLVDDVTTTGATLSEATRELKKSGAKKVFAIALAH
ncbi:MAG TPA: phosphoribosyltransferase family protein [Candidatus Paceibacterota bacterium]